MAAAAAAAAAHNRSDEPVVGNAPKHELLQPRPATQKRKDHGGGSGSESGGPSAGKSSRPSTGAHGKSEAPFERASDDYCLERFKKNMKFSRSSKIKIA